MARSAHRLGDLTHLDAALWAWALDGTVPQDLLSAVEALRPGANDQVTVETVIASGDQPLDSLGLGRSAAQIQAGLVSLALIDDASGRFVLGAWPSRYAGVFHLVGSVPTTDPRWRRVERWVSAASPSVVPCFLNNRDFEDIGTALAEFGEVEVSRLSARKQSDLSSLNRGWKARAGTLRPSHQEAIDAAEREGASVRTLSLQVGDRLSLHLRRLAGATYYGGDFSLFDEVVLGRLAMAASRRRDLLQDRHREIGLRPPRPISIRLPGSIMVDAEATGDLLDELERRRDIAVAVIHRNPYLHMAVVDYSDGSNFDVFVTDPDSIEIHPGFRASLGALSRLSQVISERFEALEVAEALEEPLVSLDELAPRP